MPTGPAGATLSDNPREPSASVSYVGLRLLLPEALLISTSPLTSDGMISTGFAGAGSLRVLFLRFVDPFFADSAFAVVFCFGFVGAWDCLGVLSRTAI